MARKDILYCGESRDDYNKLHAEVLLNKEEVIYQAITAHKHIQAYSFNIWR